MTLEQGLQARLKRLMLFRVVMVTTLLLIAVYVEAVSETLLRVNPLYFVVVTIYLLTVLHALALRFLPALRAQVYVQVVSDLLVVTSLVYLTGGGRWGFMLLYPICVLSGSVLLYRRGGLALAAVATSCYGGVLWVVRLGLVPPQGLIDVPFQPVNALHYSVLVTGVACFTVALIGSYFAESLKQVGERLVEAHGQVADLRELNQVIVSSIHSGLITTDAQGRVLYVNDFGCQILGRPAGDVRGRDLRDVFSSRRLEVFAMEARGTQELLSRLEISYERPGGALAQLGFSVTPLAAGERTGRGFLVVFQDLTEVKRLEQEVRTNEKLAAVGEMTAQLAHEIRNPLGSISGSAQVLLAEPNISREQERLLAIITRESSRLSETLNRFLFQARAPGPPMDPVDIGPLLEETVTLLRHGPEVGPDHSVEFKIDEGPHVCLADPDQIAQVFWNLARNGLEAMPQGGTLRVELRHDADSRHLLLSVRDQGKGMEREEQRRMFEPFQSRTPMGTGLGLAIVYRIVRQHRGEIRVRSVPRQGTEVEVRLPLLPSPASSGKREPGSGRQPAKTHA